MIQGIERRKTFRNNKEQLKPELPPEKGGCVFQRDENDDAGQHPFNGARRDEFLAARPEIHPRHTAYAEQNAEEPVGLHRHI